ncbi:MAG UNVERIFIED_CONTAM: hypothetical protein LVR18_20630 [Planctomycetaceae bacterium]|jgi:carboxyl-terminal processing protease
MERGQSAMKLTTAGYLRPSGINIHRYPEFKTEDVWGVSSGHRTTVEAQRRTILRLAKGLHRRR